MKERRTLEVISILKLEMLTSSKLSIGPSDNQPQCHSASMAGETNTWWTLLQSQVLCTGDVEIPNVHTVPSKAHDCVWREIFIKTVIIHQGYHRGDSDLQSFVTGSIHFAQNFRQFPTVTGSEGMDAFNDFHPKESKATGIL